MLWIVYVSMLQLVNFDLMMLLLLLLSFFVCGCRGCVWSRRNSKIIIKDEVLYPTEVWGLLQRVTSSIFLHLFIY
jgi:hypothetical protein